MPNPPMAYSPSSFHVIISFFFLLLHHFSFVSGSPSYPDLQPLLDFKNSSDTFHTLPWTTLTPSAPCSWPGVSCDSNLRVIRLVLESSRLTNSFLPLTSLPRLRVLSLKNNSFSGPIPDLSSLSSLKLLFLSNNDLSGPVPTSLASLSKLYRLDLSHNRLSGEIPPQLNRLTNLLTFRVEDNDLSGPISGLDLRFLQDFNVSGNRVSGLIPLSLSRFPISAFENSGSANNAFLCGAPLPTCHFNGSNQHPNPTQPGSAGGAIASPITVASSPSSLPTTAPDDRNKPGSAVPTHHSGGSKTSKIALIAMILGDVLALGVVSLLLYCCFMKKRGGDRAAKTSASSGRISEGEKIVYSSSPYPGATQMAERGRMVFFEGVRKFELEDLLRASAEMLGKGGFGTAYKAVLDDGNVVAVKRLKEGNCVIGGKREFEQHMELLGKLRHSNVVSLKAYYFARDEKLLVYDYMPNGSLFWLLHGNRGPGRTPLDWTTRLKIAAGAARGVAFIHSSFKSLKLTHGNIKSTNILIDRAGNACVSDFGLSIFAPATSAGAPRTNSYRAPESSDGRKPSQKADVYSFGVLLLEMLTGKCPSLIDNAVGHIGPGGGYGGAVDLPRWVQSVVREEWTAEVFDLELMRYKDIEEEMVALLQIAMACTSSSPDQRPTMNQLVKMIDDIRGVEVSPSHDTLDSVSDSPSVSEDTCRASE